MRELVITVVLGVVLGGCRLVIPSPDENQALLQRGTFVGDTPAWAAQGAALGSKRSSIGMGIMPTSFSSSPLTSPITVGDSAFSKTLAEKKAENYQKKITAEQSTAADSNVATAQSASSPLSRITAICPGLEKSVTDAITTVERPLKLRKLESLTARCQGSADLWYWLGVEFEAVGRYGEAERTLNLALSFMPEMKEATTLLAKVRESRRSQTEKGAAK